MSNLECSLGLSKSSRLQGHFGPISIWQPKAQSKLGGQVWLEPKWAKSVPNLLLKGSGLWTYPCVFFFFNKVHNLTKFIIYILLKVYYISLIKE